MAVWPQKKYLRIYIGVIKNNDIHKYNLLPKSQHGFRAMRSTMTALSEVQKQWADNSEKKNKLGFLMWDLSAAFDCLDITITLLLLLINNPNYYMLGF